MAREFKSEDEGMSVMTADGEVIGKVDKVQGDKAHVRPESTLPSAIRQRLGWTKEGEDTYELKHSSVDKFADDGIHLKKNL